MVKFRVVHIVILQLFFALVIQAQADFTSDYDPTDNCTPTIVEFLLDPSSVVIGDVDSLTWEFGHNGATYVSYDPLIPAAHIYDEPGTYTVSMILNNNAETETKVDYITTKQRMRATFVTNRIDSNTYQFVPTDIILDSTQVFFYGWTYTNTTTGRSENGKLAEINDGDISQAIDTFTFEPGENEIRLLIDHLNGCDAGLATSTIEIDQRYFTTDTTEGCLPLEINYSINTNFIDMDTVTNIEWDFGLGERINTMATDTTIVYTEPGTYDVSIAINDDDPIVWANYITAHQTVTAAFKVDEYAENNNFRFIPSDIIHDSSLTYSFLWSDTLTDGTTRSNLYYVNSGNIASANNTVTLAEGTHRVNLTVLDTINGCLSSYNKTVYAYPEIQVPNIFIPGEGRLFTIDPQNISTVLHFEVFNRYGLPIFIQTAPVINWDGKSNQGKNLTTGVYFYTLEATLGDPLNKYVQKGFIHIYY